MPTADGGLLCKCSAVQKPAFTGYCDHQMSAKQTFKSHTHGGPHGERHCFASPYSIHRLLLGRNRWRSNKLRSHRTIQNKNVGGGTTSQWVMNVWEPHLWWKQRCSQWGNSGSLSLWFGPGPEQQFIVMCLQYCRHNSPLHELMSCLAFVWHVAAPSGSSHLLNESLPPPTHPGTCQDRYRPPRRLTGGEGKLWMTKSCISNHWATWLQRR